jgi:hypothetical protein
MHFGYAKSAVNLQVKFLDQEFPKQHCMFLESLFLLVHFVLFKTCLESWLVYAKIQWTHEACDQHPPYLHNLLADGAQSTWVEMLVNTFPST